MKRMLLGAAAAVTLLTGLAPAGAKPPVTAPTMSAARGSQAGVAMSSTSGGSSDRGRTCVFVAYERVGSYPDAVRHDGSALTWRIPDRRRPTSAVATVATDVPVASVPGRSRTLPVTLAPVKARGKTVAWTATATDVGYGDLHLNLSLRWGGGCVSDQATYLYRALSLPVAP